jgi:hypothetical protein
MRANTSVLGHILGSHPEIEGYYEMHMGYESRKSLWRLRLMYLQDHAPKKESHIFFDKILHNYCKIETEILKSPATKTIFMLRNPERTIKSTVELFSKNKNSHAYSKPEYAVFYYIDRINKLLEIAEGIKNKYYYLDAESITENPQTCLSELGAWLELKTPLKTEYKLFSKTGKVKAGDSSENIKSGKILKTNQDYKHIHIPPELLQKAQQAYRICRTRLIQGSQKHFTLDSD